MAQYFNDFSAYPTGVQPSDFTKRWDTYSFTATVETVSGVTGGQVLQFVKSGNTAAGLSWDKIDGDANRDNVEIVARLRRTTSSGTYGLGLLARAQNPESTRTGYFITSTGGLRSSRYLSGSFNNFASTADTAIEGVWQYVRARFNGTTVQAKVWTGTIGDEPTGAAEWGINTTNSDISAAGWAGIFNFQQATYEYDFLGIGTNGDPAPTKPIPTFSKVERFHDFDPNGGSLFSKPLTIGANDKNRALVVWASETRNPNSVQSVKFNGVEGTLLYADDKGELEGWLVYWLNADLPPTAGTYNLELSTYEGGSDVLTGVYFEGAKQDALTNSASLGVTDVRPHDSTLSLNPVPENSYTFYAGIVFATFGPLEVPADYLVVANEYVGSGARTVVLAAGEASPSYGTIDKDDAIYAAVNIEPLGLPTVPTTPINLGVTNLQATSARLTWQDG